MIEEIKVKASLIIELKSIRHWANKIPNALPEKLPGEYFLFLDKNGNVLFRGLDFHIAEAMDCFPVSVFRLESVSEKFNKK